jgi:hypothetical protein
LKHERDSTSATKPEHIYILRTRESKRAREKESKRARRAKKEETRIAGNLKFYRNRDTAGSVSKFYIPN